MADIGNRMIEFIGERDKERKRNVMNETLGVGSAGRNQCGKEEEEMLKQKEIIIKCQIKKIFKTEFFFWGGGYRY